MQRGALPDPRVKPEGNKLGPRVKPEGNKLGPREATLLMLIKGKTNDTR
jgi:hypothetical protein